MQRLESTERQREILFRVEEENTAGSEENGIEQKGFYEGIKEKREREYSFRCGL